MRNIQRRIPKTGIILFVCFAFLALFPLCAHAEETEQKVTIYGLSSSIQEKISIPEDMPQSYQITVGSGKDVSYSIISGNSAKVSANGLVTPRYTYWKRYPSYSTSVPEGQEYDYYTLNSGDTNIAVKTADKTYNITVNVKDYSITYGDKVMDAYLEENIKEGMTDQEIMNAIARFPASYDYSASCSSVYSMIIYGGGDCWASTSAIITLCQKMEIKSWARNGNKDPGAGSGHMNAMAELNGTYYELEAGYSMSKQNGYRPYNVTVRESLFSYYTSSSGLTIYQYDGYEAPGILEVPETIGGRTVTKIAGSAFSKGEFTEIRLPDTLTEIGESAFYSCRELTRLEIPASVTSIGDFVFTNCVKLTNLSVADGNVNYKSEGQVIYSKDGSTLVVCPAADEVTIPSTVTKIADYAFYYNKNLTKIVIPESVVEIEEGAFGDCSGLSVLRIPSSVKSIGAYAFANCSYLTHIYFMGDAPEFGETIEGDFYDTVFYGCSINAYYIENNATWTREALGNHGGTVEWLPWGGTEGISIENAKLALAEGDYTYTGMYITPTVSLTIDGTPLVEDTDYVVAYSNNVNAGTAKVTVMGIGSYYGEASLSFTIGKAKQDIRAYLIRDKITENDTSEILVVSVDGDCTYTSQNPYVATVDSEGIVKGIAFGEADIVISTKETDNYLASETTVKITVGHDPDMEAVDMTVTDGCIKLKCNQCKQFYSVTVPTAYTIYWSRDGYSFSTGWGSEYQVGEFLECLCVDTSNAALKEMEVISQDESIITVTENKRLNFIADGVATVVVRPKYNPAIGRSFTFYVGNASKEEGNPGNENPGNNNQTNKVTKYYDKKTGITVSLDTNGKKEATLTTVDKKYAKGNLKVPAAIKVNGKSYKITAVGKNAFKNQKQLQKVTLGKYVKTIGESAFSGCTKLQAVTIGSNVTVIDNKAFYKCVKLGKIVIPAKVKKIGKSAFYGCKNLKNITIKSKSLTTKNVGSKAFNSINKKPTIKVPKSKLSEYKRLLKSKGVGSKARIKA